MILTDELIGLMAKKRYSQSKMARRLGIAPKTFYTKMRKGIFGSDEIEVMIETLEIENPMPLFFARKVT